MFTGIIETVGRVSAIESNGSNKTFTILSDLSGTFKVDQSISHNGVCLTVECCQQGSHTVTAVEETLKKTTLGSWKEGDLINIEQCLAANGRLDGHFVQGHVDTTGTCLEKITRDGSWEYVVSFPKEFAALVIEKGSISLNGISLTVFNVAEDRFSVAIIPYTYEHTNMIVLEAGDQVNLEFDLLGKYILRKLMLSS
jgi:riboflavin synthase